ncbi:hypothetical protein QQY66_16235 [Streptomyces sp. DG2A-72]|uniref:hypothetical protein n=1 Tax=Streptomyces sp. DG2A-72 TaxID=3051386 RepID=UPI00265C0F21|nr:hypothetical protein [Streptomyces sp. DG2A-72]MDO0933165.1 hypothetical protein [Streptomyces sp. DG2A-72]
MTAEHNGTDALMAALTDEPLTDEARADAAFMTEHESALADLELLREQLGAIGDALAAEPAKKKAEKPAPAVRQRGRRTLRFALGGLAVACAASLFAGMGWLVVQAGSGTDDSGSGTVAEASASDSSGKAESDSSGKAESLSKSRARYLACAHLVVEGTVTAVVPVPGTAQERVTLDVTRSYKPAKGEDEVVFVMDEDILNKGDHALIGLPRNAASPDMWAVGRKDIARERAWITRALPESRTLTCE